MFSSLFTKAAFGNALEPSTREKCETNMSAAFTHIPKHILLSLGRFSLTACLCMGRYKSKYKCRDSASPQKCMHELRQPIENPKANM